MIGVLIFDDGCPFCSRVARFLEKFNIKTIPLKNAGKFLIDIMGETFPIALYFIPKGGEGIYWGEEAVFMVMRKLGMGPLSYTAYILYPILKKINRNAEKINRQHGICGCMLSGSRQIGGEKVEKLIQELLMT